MNEQQEKYTTTEKEFYGSIPNPQTSKEYRNGFQRFSMWFGKTPTNQAGPEAHGTSQTG